MAWSWQLGRRALLGLAVALGHGELADHPGHGDLVLALLDELREQRRPLEEQPDRGVDEDLDRVLDGLFGRRLLGELGSVGPARSRGAILSARGVGDQDVARRVVGHGGGDAAEDEVGGAREALRADDDQVGVEVLGRLEEHVGRVAGDGLDDHLVDPGAPWRSARPRSASSSACTRSDSAKRMSSGTASRAGDPAAAPGHVGGDDHDPGPVGDGHGGGWATARSAVGDPSVPTTMLA